MTVFDLFLESQDCSDWSFWQSRHPNLFFVFGLLASANSTKKSSFCIHCLLLFVF